MKRLGLVFLVGVLLLSVSVSAADVHEDQEEITLIMEQGSILEFPLVLLYIHASDKDLFVYGDLDNWIMFGEAKLNTHYFSQDAWIDAVKVTIDIPEDAEVGEYEGGIASDDILSDITIRVVPPLGDIQSMQDLQEIKEELQEMTESISQELNDTKENLQGRIAEISEYQQNLTGLEEELGKLREKSQELEETNTQLTGQVAGGGSAQLGVGIVIGIIIVILFLYRGRLAKSLRGARRGSGRIEAGEYRGWKH